MLVGKIGRLHGYFSILIFLVFALPCSMDHGLRNRLKVELHLAFRNLEAGIESEFHI